MLYNPFEQVTKSSFREFGESGYVDFVLQRFECLTSRKRLAFYSHLIIQETSDQHTLNPRGRREEQKL